MLKTDKAFDKALEVLNNTELYNATLAPPSKEGELILKKLEEKVKDEYVTEE